ncbi:hypothetical protein BDZ91DRAFT_517609 [Kalaharituber pfeilii]|nr:hypothetical protein BDZ91DRAFT_517609 [Kalaharituber pfeilii]
MATAVAPARRPKLSLQINSNHPTTFTPIQQAPIMPRSKPVLSLPVPAVGTPRRSRYSYGDLSDSEEDGKFWSGEDASSATSSSDDDEATTSLFENKINGDTVVLPSPSVTSPFLPPATGMKFPTPVQRPGMTKLRLITTLPPAQSMASPVVGPQQPQRTKLSLSIPSLPPALPRRLGVLPSPISPVTATSSFSFPLKKSSLSSSFKPRKSVTFSSEPDVVISTTKYTLTNSDLLDYLSSEECSEEELNKKWGMTVEEGRMLGMPRSSVDRRERKWIGLTNSFVKGKLITDEDDE